MHHKQREESLTLEMLEAIHEQGDVTQRHLAGRMGVALGLTNSYLKRCVRKGLVKVQQAPANRYLYYLTPKGFAEKSRLTGRYLSISFTFYRRAGASCADAFADCRQRGYQRIGLCGASDLAEIAALRALEHEVQIACVLDANHDAERLLNLPVVRALADAEAVDAWLLTELTDPQAAYDRLVGTVPAERVVVPEILGVRTAGGAHRRGPNEPVMEMKR